MNSNRELVLLRLLIGGSILFFLGMVIYSGASEEPLTELELLLFQIIISGLGFAGSYLLGRRSATEAATEVIRPHAISAFRRVVSLYEALRRFVVTIEGQRERLLERADREPNGSVPFVQVDSTLELFIVQITEQIGTANDAADDWRDIVPNEVDRVEKALRARREGAVDDTP